MKTIGKTRTDSAQKNGSRRHKGLDARLADSKDAHIGVFIICWVHLYLQALAESLARDDEINVVGSAGVIEDGLELIRETSPDLIIVDLPATNGPSGIRLLAQVEPGRKILCLGNSDLPMDTATLGGSAVAFVSRHRSINRVIEVVKRTARGEGVASEPVHAAASAGVETVEAHHESGSTLTRLTSREIEVLRLIDQGFSNKEIAQALYIEVATVKNHVHNILQKLNLRRRAHAAIWLRRHGGTLLDVHGSLGARVLSEPI